MRGKVNRREEGGGAREEDGGIIRDFTTSQQYDYLPYSMVQGGVTSSKDHSQYVVALKCCQQRLGACITNLVVVEPELCRVGKTMIAKTSSLARSNTGSRSMVRC